jgi:hypothetical protein
VGQVQPAVDRVHGWRSREGAEGKGEVIHVAVDHVEVGGPREHHPQLARERDREQVAGVGAVAHGALDDRHQRRGGAGVTAGEQRDVVATPDQLLGQARHDALRAPVEPRRHRLEEGGNLGDTHG